MNAKKVDQGIKWLIDTGASVNVIPKEEVPKGSKLCDDNSPVYFETANGQAVSNETYKYRVGPLGKEIVLHSLPGSPPLLGIGALCMEEGFTFLWKSGSKNPILVRKDGMVLDCVVSDNCPFLHSDASVRLPVFADNLEVCPPVGLDPFATKNEARRAVAALHESETVPETVFDNDCEDRYADESETDPGTVFDNDCEDSY